jgi:hypothetical protein
MSAAVASEDAEHDFLEGRPKIVMRKSSNPMMPGLSRPGMMFKRSSTVPMEQETERHPHPLHYNDFGKLPTPLKHDFWSEPPAASFKVRMAEFDSFNAGI